MAMPIPHTLMAPTMRQRTATEVSMSGAVVAVTIMGTTTIVGGITAMGTDTGKAVMAVGMGEDMGAGTGAKRALISACNTILPLSAVALALGWATASNPFQAVWRNAANTKPP